MARQRTRRQLEAGVADVVRGSRGRRLAEPASTANTRLYELVHNRFFDSVPLAEVFDIVERAGFRLDPDEKECILTGRDGRATWDLYGSAPGQTLDHMLVLHWHKMDTTGRYEIVAYVS